MMMILNCSTGYWKEFDNNFLRQRILCDYIYLFLQFKWHRHILVVVIDVIVIFDTSQTMSPISLFSQVLFTFFKLCHLINVYVYRQPLARSWSATYTGCRKKPSVFPRVRRGSALSWAGFRKGIRKRKINKTEKSFNIWKPSNIALVW